MTRVQQQHRVSGRGRDITRASCELLVYLDIESRIAYFLAQIGSRRLDSKTIGLELTLAHT